jgi:methyl-accepting chemotaxis protein
LLGRLHLKVLLVVGSVVCLAMASLVVANRLWQKSTLIENGVAAAMHVSDATYAGLAGPMEAGNNQAIAMHLATVAQTMPGVEIYLLDSDRGIAFASVPSAVGTPLAQRLPDRELNAAVGAAMGPAAAEKPLRLADSPPVVLRPIRNAPSCFHCHGEARPVLGGLLVRQTRDEVGERLSAALWQTLFAGLVVALLVIGLVFGLLSSLVVQPLSQIAKAAGAIAAGDLTASARTEGNALARQLDRLVGRDEIGQLAQVFGGMAENLRGVLKDLQQATSTLDQQAGAAQGAAARQSAMASEQSAAVSETTAVVAQISQTSKLSTERADAVAGTCDRTDAAAASGQQAVSEALSGLQQLASQVGSIASSITELSELTRRIAEIVASVEDLSDQSNLLALNAAIEASRAGESGQGFAVVAAEMRRLARKSKDSAGEARKLLSRVVAGTRAAVQETEEGSRRADQAAHLAQSAGGSIDAMPAAMRESAEAAKEIAVHARQQTTGVDQIATAVSQLSAAVGDSVEGTRRVQEIAESLTEVSKRLTGLAQRFKA